VHQREITSSQATAALKALRSDLHEALLVHASTELAAIFQRVQKFFTKYSIRLGTRSLDLLHIVAALESGCKKCAPLDIRQRERAKHE
jgi:hypothetical protein